MIEIDWKKDYQREFQCPQCKKVGLRLRGSEANKKRFRCPNCNKNVAQYYSLTKNYFFNVLSCSGFACPDEKCNARQMVVHQANKNKKQFICKVCGATAVESNDLIKTNLSRYSQQDLKIKAFVFEEDLWDLRAINHFIDAQSNGYFVNYSQIKINWFKLLAKNYIYHLCKLNTAFKTIDKYMTVFRQFSVYLLEKNISNIEEINRNLILDFTAWSDTTCDIVVTRLRSLRRFFITGNIQGWFHIDPDIIRDSDYPKRHINNPDPIPDVVREQIERNLHKLPDPIARMWIICFFAAMRPYELALLKKDCLEQVGDKWKLVWWRKKGKKFHQHSVPITTTIAKVVQEQLEYIEDLWGKDWEYLFCHYHNISQSDPSHPRLKLVRKVIPSSKNPLQNAIRTLINPLLSLSEN